MLQTMQFKQLISTTEETPNSRETVMSANYRKPKSKYRAFPRMHRDDKQKRSTLTIAKNDFLSVLQPTWLRARASSRMEMGVTTLPIEEAVDVWARGRKQDSHRRR